MNENSELMVFRNIKFLGETCSNPSNDLLRISMYTRLLNLVDNRC